MQGQAWPQKHVDVITRDKDVDFPLSQQSLQAVVGQLSGKGCWFINGAD